MKPSNQTTSTIQENRERHEAAVANIEDNLKNQGATTQKEVTNHALDKNGDTVESRTDLVVKTDTPLDVPQGHTANALRPASNIKTKEEHLAPNPVTQITPDSTGKAQIEVKTGNADLTNNQKNNYKEATKGNATGVGDNAERIELKDDVMPTTVYEIKPD